MDSVFSDMAAFVNRCTERIEKASLTKAHMLYSERAISMTTDDAKR